MQLAWKVEAGSNVKLQDYDPDYVDEHTDPALARAELEQLGKELGELQELLAAAHHHSLLVVLQGMDTSGKADTIHQVLSRVNPQGCQVRSFKVPTSRELDHDFLWRVHRVTPGRGIIGIFNRSHYENVLVVRVHNLVPQEAWSRHYAAINDFERLLAQNDMIILKLYLHMSYEEQERRLLAQQKNQTDAWKVTTADWAERKYWDDYHAYWPNSRIKRMHGKSLLLIGLSVNTGTSIKRPTRRRSPSAVRMKRPGISFLLTRSGIAICSWHGHSLLPCVSIRMSGKRN